ncbi:PH domain-containing protein [Microbacterium sp. NPDC057407]|uniref:PH domain-containing protein n=1 Tax=Microbacterium sp. NPDC057407 TaxID=3346120 RepID=UPI00366A76C2
MSSIEKPRRLSGASIPAYWLHNAPGIVGLLGALWAYSTDSGLWPGSWAVVPIGLLLTVRLGHPLLAWATVRFDLDAEALWLRTGMILVSTRTIPWATVRVVERHQPWAYRIFGLVVVSLRAGASEDARCTLVGVADGAVDLISSKAEHASPMLAAIPNTQDVVYRARRSELLTGTVTHGQFILVAAGASAAASDSLRSLGLLDGLLIEAGKAPIVWAIAAASMSVAASITITLMRYHRFEVTRTVDRVTISYGWFGRFERTLSSSAIVGVRIERNLAEMAMDRVRVSLYSGDTAERVSRNLVLPSLPRTAAARIVSGLLPALSGTAVLETSGRSSLCRALLMNLATVAVAVGTFMLVFSLWPFAIGVAVLFGVTSGVLARVLSTLVSARLGTEAGSFRLRVRGLTEREDVVRSDAIHLVALFKLGRQPLVIRAHYFAGVAQVLTAITSASAVNDIGPALLRPERSTGPRP